MRFGISLSSDDPTSVAGGERISQHLERATLAAEVGFETLGFNHRYSYTPAESDERGHPLTSWRLQPIPLIAHVAARLGDDVGYLTSILLSTSTHPVQLVEDVATVDAMTGGKLTLGMALGWLPYEFEAFGVSRSQRTARFEELLRLTRRLLTEDDVSFTGAYFDVRTARVIARPVQRPHPPIWVGGLVDAAVRRAAIFGDAWLMGSHSTRDELREQLAMYAMIRTERNLPIPVDRPINRVIYIDEDRERALADARPALIAWYEKRRQWGWEVQPGDIDAELLSGQRWLVGNPDDCIRQIHALEDQLGVTHVNVSSAPRLAAHEQRLRTIRLVGSAVIPAVA